MATRAWPCSGADGRRTERVSPSADNQTRDTAPTGEPDRHHRQHEEHGRHHTDKKEETSRYTVKQESGPANADQTDDGIARQIRTVAESIIESGDQDQVGVLLRLLSSAQARGIEISAHTDELVEQALNKKTGGTGGGHGPGLYISIAV